MAHHLVAEGSYHATWWSLPALASVPLAQRAGSAMSARALVSTCLWTVVVMGLAL
jgi:hypothetical protein